MPFKPGVSGNKKGRPKGIVDRRMIINAKHKRLVWSKIIELAEQGNTHALQMAADRCLPKIKPEYEKVTLPKFTNARSYADEVIAQVADGKIAPNVGRDLLELATQQVNLVDMQELLTRIEEIETGKFDGTFDPPSATAPKAKRRSRKRIRFRE